jgi:hypothetical protein
MRLRLPCRFLPVYVCVTQASVGDGEGASGYCSFPPIPCPHLPPPPPHRSMWEKLTLYITLLSVYVTVRTFSKKISGTLAKLFSRWKCNFLLKVRARVYLLNGPYLPSPHTRRYTVNVLAASRPPTSKEEGVRRMEGL